jgi:hypothetical protein
MYIFGYSVYIYIPRVVIKHYFDIIPDIKYLVSPQYRVLLEELINLLMIKNFIFLAIRELSYTIIWLSQYQIYRIYVHNYVDRFNRNLA